jgi:hypothetical protein
MNLTWFCSDPAALAARLRAARVPWSGSAFVLGHAAARLRIAAAHHATEERLVADGPPESGPAGELRVPALGWGTVDALRLAADAAWALEPLAVDDLLGAFAWRVVDVRPVTVLLEPSTEGPTAGALARHGEGPIAIYGADPTPGVTTGARYTPLGRARLDVPSRWGPFLVIVSAVPPRVPSAA